MKPTIIIGCGYWGLNYLKELGGNCVAIVDKNKDRLSEICKTYPIACFESVEELLEKGSKQGVFLDEVQHVIISTPPETHWSYAKSFAIEGKYVLVEKPFVTSSQEVQYLLPHRDRIMVAHIYTYNPGIWALKDRMRETPIHHIFSRRTNDGPVRPWQNAVWDLASHDISICNFLLDQSPLSYDIIDGYDYGIIKLEYIACQALIYVSWLGGPKVRQVELIPATSGDRIVYDDMTQVHVPSPLNLMLKAFYSHDWNKWCSVEAGLDIVKILEETNVVT